MFRIVFTLCIGKTMTCNSGFRIPGFRVALDEGVGFKWGMCQIRSIFSRLDYLIGLINSTINMFIQNIVTKPEKKTDDGNTIRTNSSLQRSDSR